MNDFSVIQFINDIVKLSPRQGANEKKAARLISCSLNSYCIKYRTQEFVAKIPLIKKAILKVDGEKIECKGCSFVGGKIGNKDSLISSLVSSQPFIGNSNINFNPRCKGISLSNFYFAASLAIRASDVNKIIKSKSLSGNVEVAPYKYRSSNILVGNFASPKNILFAHYDSIERGAIDNASGVGALVYIILKYPEVLGNSLIVFSGNEELSYDYPIYWGHGFREFENKNYDLLKKARKIFIIDCIGNSKSVINKDKELAIKGFPLKNLDKLENKILLVHGNAEDLMRVYHSDLDTVKCIKEKYIFDAIKIILKNLDR